MDAPPGAAVDDERWLHAWSAAAALPEWRRVPALVAALGDGAVDDPEDWPLGAVAASAMALVTPLCGGTLHASAACATCGEAMEVTLPVADLVALAGAGGEAAGAIDTAGHRLTLRAPAPRTSPPSPLERTTLTWPPGCCSDGASPPPTRSSPPPCRQRWWPRSRRRWRPSTLSPW